MVEWLIIITCGADRKRKWRKGGENLIVDPFFLCLLSVRPWIYKLFSKVNDVSKSSGEYEYQACSGSLVTKPDLNLFAWFVYQLQVYNSLETHFSSYIHTESGIGIAQDCSSNVNSVQKEIISLVIGMNLRNNGGVETFEESVNSVSKATNPLVVILLPL